MSDSPPVKKSKNQRRRERERSEKQAGRLLDAAATAAIDEALRLAPAVSRAEKRADRCQVIESDVATVDAAKYVRKRANEALRPAEWHDVVTVTVWEHDVDIDDALSERGAELGFELRLVQRVL